jgi:hypothetical protein
MKMKVSASMLSGVCLGIILIGTRLTLVARSQYENVEQPSGTRRVP